MANATTDSNSNPIGVPANTNTTVSSISLKIPGAKAHKVLLIGEFSAESALCANDFVVGDIQIDGNTFTNTQVNNLNGAVGAIVVVSGVATVKPGLHKFDLRAFTRATGLSAHHRALSGIDLGV
jgi:hypothetical protein